MADLAAPPPANDGPELLVDWLPITQLLDEATKDFKLGQMMKLPSLSLLDAMAAIEIMDPKMDAGMALPGTDSMTVHDVFEQGLVKRVGYSSEELVDLIDDLTIAEMRTVAGDMLCQTILTWAHMHRPLVFEDPVIQAVCVSMALSIQTMRDRVARAGVAEEEDQLLEHRASEVLIAFAVPDEVLPKLAKATQEASTRSEAVSHRLVLRTLWIQFLLELEKESYAKAQELSGQLKASLRAVRSSINLSSRSFNREQAYEYFEHVVGYLESICKMTQATSLTEVMRLVDLVCSAQPTPPIYMRSRLRSTLFIEKERDDPLLFGKLSLYKHILPHEIAQLSHAPYCAQASLPASFSTKAESSKSTKSAPKVSPTLFLPEIAPDVVQSLESFFPTLAKNVVEIFHVRVKNRTRFQRRLKRTLGEWESLQILAEHLDDTITSSMKESNADRPEVSLFPNHLSTFVCLHKIRMMREYLLLGFELDMYRPNEYLMIYWYVDALMETEAGYRQILAQFVISDIDKRALAVRTAPITSRGGAKYVEAFNQAANPFPPHTIAELVLLFVKQNVIRGVIRLLVALTQDDIYQTSKPVFGSEELIFNHRFEPFVAITSPIPLSYSEYRQSLFSQQHDSAKLYEMANDAFVQARKLLEKFNKLTVAETDSVHSEAVLKQEVTTYGRVAIANSLFCAGHSKSPYRNVRLEFRQHSYLPIFVGIA